MLLCCRLTYVDAVSRHMVPCVLNVFVVPCLQWLCVVYEPYTTHIVHVAVADQAHHLVFIVKAGMRAD